ncbi:MAG: Short-chain dehydrogenase/reductase [Frankiales bacterium]|nr:Short-chain dehydrogenase/reductase [Frankiales bacterium]
MTGANSGIGWYVARALARRGAAVTMACRDLVKGQRAVDRLMASVPRALIELRPLDLAALDSVAEFAAGWTGPLDLLVNNAGIMAPPKWRPTQDGFELQFGTNHLGHFALTGQLLPALLEGAQPRVVTVSSLAHGRGNAGVLAGNPPSGYNPQLSYAQSKLANLLFGLELQRRAGRDLISTVAHPGVANTNLFRSEDGMGANPMVRSGGALLGRLIFQSPQAGAEPILYAADVAGPGSYSGPRWLRGWRGPAGPAAMSSFASDERLAADLWDISEELTGVKYGWR